MAQSSYGNSPSLTLSSELSLAPTATSSTLVLSPASERPLAVRSNRQELGALDFLDSAYMTSTESLSAEKFYSAGDFKTIRGMQFTTFTAKQTAARMHYDSVPSTNHLFLAMSKRTASSSTAGSRKKPHVFVVDESGRHARPRVNVLRSYTITRTITGRPGQRRVAEAISHHPLQPPPPLIMDDPVTDQHEGYSHPRHQKGKPSGPECIISAHLMLPLHRIEVWQDTHFQRTSLCSLGSSVQLGHCGHRCPTPIPASYQFTGPGPATFMVLECFHELTLQGKLNIFDFYNALLRISDGSGVTDFTNVLLALIQDATCLMVGKLLLEMLCTFTCYICQWMQTFGFL
ncbi:hypothetical protein DFH29DRAFT_879960 [Suillus ampliporus]|nr:hypothetical protein DFH29DRAFT_879960 [Suillus ampliporus]